MGAEWKPGDVVLIPGVGRAICTGDGSKVLVGRRTSQERDLRGFAGVRKLVVLDPETFSSFDGPDDVAYIQGLQTNASNRLDGMLGADILAAVADQLQQAVRKPEEPTGLGAVVEDAKGERWTRNDGPESCCWRNGTRGVWLGWSDINVPDESHILSRGVEVSS